MSYNVKDEDANNGEFPYDYANEELFDDDEDEYEEGDDDFCD